jgi:thioredoxin-like negative regulator of GroEL
MNSIPPIAEITASSFEGCVLCSELPVLVLFCADGDGAGKQLLDWLGERRFRTSNLVNMVQVAQAETRSLAARWGIPSVPSLALFYAGAVCYQFCGHFSRRELDDVLARAALMGSSQHSALASENQAIEGRSDGEP